MPGGLYIVSSVHNIDIGDVLSIIVKCYHVRTFSYKLGSKLPVLFFEQIKITTSKF